MPVANSQIEELYGIFRQHLSQTELLQILDELKDTEAYRSNSSFAMTIDRLLLLIKPVESAKKAMLVPILSKKYRLHYLRPGNKLPRMCVMTYIGHELNDGVTLVFDARPESGTVKIPREWITHIEQVPNWEPVVINEIVH